MKPLLWLLPVLGVLIGCSNLKGPNQSYVAPAVEGRVTDARTGEPLKNARIQRHLGDPAPPDPWKEKGAQRLMRSPTVTSGPDGRFRFDPLRGGYLLLQRPGVYQFTLVVRHRDYPTLSTNIDLLQIRPVRTNNVLTVFVGDLALEPGEPPER